jgi:hypothetical protein
VVFPPGIPHGGDESIKHTRRGLGPIVATILRTCSMQQLPPDIRHRTSSSSSRCRLRRSAGLLALAARGAWAAAPVRAPPAAAAATLVALRRALRRGAVSPCTVAALPAGSRGGSGVPASHHPHIWRAPDSRRGCSGGLHRACAAHRRSGPTCRAGALRGGAAAATAAAVAVASGRAVGRTLPAAAPGAAGLAARPAFASQLLPVVLLLGWVSVRSALLPGRVVAARVVAAPATACATARPAVAAAPPAALHRTTTLRARTATWGSDRPGTPRKARPKVVGRHGSCLLGDVGSGLRARAARAVKRTVKAAAAVAAPAVPAPAAAAVAAPAVSAAAAAAAATPTAAAATPKVGRGCLLCRRLGQLSSNLVLPGHRRRHRQGLGRSLLGLLLLLLAAAARRAWAALAALPPLASLPLGARRLLRGVGLAARLCSGGAACRRSRLLPLLTLLLLLLPLLLLVWLLALGPTARRLRHLVADAAAAAGARVAGDGSAAAALPRPRGGGGPALHLLLSRRLLSQRRHVSGVDAQAGQLTVGVGHVGLGGGCGGCRLDLQGARHALGCL